MKKRRGGRKLVLATGCALVVCSLVLLAWRQISVCYAAKKSDGYVEILNEILPESRFAVLEQKSDNAMPVLSVNGTDIVGLVEFPERGRTLPVRAEWSSRLFLPSRYTGSVYDGSLVVGATTQKGQMDFYCEIEVGDVVWFTDMTGDRYAYEVADILYRKHADNETLTADGAEFVLFAKNVYAFEYIVIRCTSLT